MGLGHVSSRPIPRDGQGADLSRRQRRKAGEDGAQALTRDRRASIGAAGESLAAWWLENRGLSLIARNVKLARGEIDLVVDDLGARVVVEVRTIRGSGDPIDAVTERKRQRVRMLSSGIGASRVDFLGVSLKEDAVEFHWVPG